MRSDLERGFTGVRASLKAKNRLGAATALSQVDQRFRGEPTEGRGSRFLFDIQPDQL
jgi:hypothetical protein